MVIKDTLKAAELFAKFDVPLSGYIMNRVLPLGLKDQNIPEYLKNRLEMQEHYLKVIDTTFGKEILKKKLLIKRPDCSSRGRETQY
jgi:arsenite-transporting ATPase